MPMETRNELLPNLEEDGKHYAHFFTHNSYPGYYGVWVRERTPEYINMWMPESPLAGYNLAFSIEMPDTEFSEYMAEVYPEQIDVPFLKVLCLIEDVSDPQKWVTGFKQWKQEKIRLNRVKWLEQYPWVVSTPSKKF
jgi:hypothetical protein